MPTQDSRGPALSPVRLNLLFLGLTAILIGYFLVWLSGPSAGLQIIGIELGEWIKFLGVGARRNWFYLPPIVVGLSLALLAATWPNRPQTWLARGVAVAVAMLAFPAVAAIQLEPSSEWLVRLLLIGLVALVAAGGALIARRASGSVWVWPVMAAVALIGLLLPALQYFAVRPVVEDILLQPVGVGLGVWLNAGGALLVALIAIAHFLQGKQTKNSHR